MLGGRLRSLPNHHCESQTVTRYIKKASIPDGSKLFFLLYLVRVALLARSAKRTTLVPDRRRENDKHGEDLQTAEEHQKTQHDLGKIRERRIIAHGTDDLPKAGADVVKTSDDRGKCGFKV